MMTVMSENGNKIEASEDEMVALAGPATKSAYRRALRLGHSVLISREGGIYRAHPDGTFVFIKKAKRPFKVEEGTVIEIK
jgi:hypothetical protein